MTINEEIKNKLDEVKKLIEELDKEIIDLVEDDKLEDAIKLADKMDEYTEYRFDFATTYNY